MFEVFVVLFGLGYVLVALLLVKIVKDNHAEDD